MSKYVAIVETVADSLDKKHESLPPDYPLLCKEFETKEEAERSHPGKTVMSIDEYRGFNWGMNLLFNHIEANQKSPWWKMWGK